MGQATLERYFTFPPKSRRPGLSFLDLPRHVRQKVYIFAGIVHQRPLSLNRVKEPSGEEEDQRQVLRYCPYWVQIPLQLFHVSRIVSEEASFLFYTENRFRISYSSPGGLSAIECLRPNTLAILKALEITLSKSAGLGSSPLLPSVNTQSRAYRIWMDGWSRICVRLSSHIRGSYLRLSLICDTNSYDFAREVLAPLKQLPTLAECSIRLGHPYQPHTNPQLLYSLACDAALALTDRSTPASKLPSKRFRYGDLPGELQGRILEFTDLVAPYDLSWIPKVGFKCDYYRQDINYCFICYQGEKCCYLPHMTPGSSGKKTAAVECSCWRFPIRLFLVNRRMHADATRIFYSLNHFKIVRYGCRWHIWDTTDMEGTPNQFALAPFIASIPTYALRYLRSVQFLPSDLPATVSRHPDGYQKWDEMVNLLSLHGEPSLLRLTIDMSEDRCRWISGPGNPDEPVPATRDLKFRTHFERLVEPFTVKGGFPRPRDFFIHLSWPAYSSDFRVRRARWEKTLEARVMGKEYDSSSRGKFAVPGRWYDDQTGLTNPTHALNHAMR